MSGKDYENEVNKYGKAHDIPIHVGITSNKTYDNKSIEI